MSQLQVIFEEKSEEKGYKKSKTHAQAPAKLDLSKSRSDSSYSSEDSSFAESLDTEIKEIKMITENLRESVTNKLNRFKKYSKSYIQINKAIDECIHKYTYIEPVKTTVSSVAVQSFETCEEVNKGKEKDSIVRINSKKTIEKLRNEIAMMQEVLNVKERVREEREKENFDLREMIEKVNEVKQNDLELKIRHSGCSCRIF